MLIFNEYIWGGIISNYSKEVEEIILFFKSNNFMLEELHKDINVNVVYNENKFHEHLWDEKYDWKLYREGKVTEIEEKLDSLENKELIKKELELIYENLKKEMKNKWLIERKIRIKEKNIVNKYIEEYYDDILADIYHCVLSRYIGKVIFFEKIFEVYKNGGIPCGWNGEYPEGNIIAYFKCKE